MRLKRALRDSKTALVQEEAWSPALRTSRRLLGDRMVSGLPEAGGTSPMRRNLRSSMSISVIAEGAGDPGILFRDDMSSARTHESKKVA
jgi:hypothetical protein